MNARFILGRLVWSIFSSCLLICPASSLGQKHSFINYTTADGMATNEVYHLTQDDRKRLLITSELGLMRFDGQRFELLPFQEPNLGGSTLFEIKKDHRGKIWIASYHHGLFFLDGDTLRPHPANAELQEKLYPSYIADFSPDSSGGFWLIPSRSKDRFSKQFEVVYLQPDGGISTRSVPMVQNGVIASQFAFELPGGNWLACRNLNFLTSGRGFHQPEGEDRLLHEAGGIRLISPNELTGTPAKRHGPVIKTRSGVVLSSTNRLHLIPDVGGNGWSTTLPDQVLDLLPLQDGGWFAGTWKGAYLFPDTTGEPGVFFPKQSVSDIYQDHEGGYWFATIDQGLFFVPSLAIREFRHPSFSEQRILHLSAHPSSGVGVATANGTTHLFQSQGDSLVLRGSIQLKQPSSKRFHLGGNAIFHARGRANLPPNVGVAPYPDSVRGLAHDIRLGGDSLILLIRKASIVVHRITPEGIQPLLWDGKVPSAFPTTGLLSGDSVLLGTDRGLMVSPVQPWNPVPCFPEINGLHIVDVAALSSKRLAVATKAAGLFILDLPTQTTIWHLSEASGLSSPNCRKLLVESDSAIWVASNRGLNRVMLGKGSPDVQSFFASDGLVSDRITSLGMSGGWVFAGSLHRISYFRPEEITPNRVHPSPELTRVNANGHDYAPSPEIVLEPGNDYVRMEFNALSFRKNQALKFAYRLRELDTNWTMTSDRHAHFGHLPANTYTFDLRVFYGEGPTRFGEETHTLVVLPLLHERAWFFPVLAVLLIGLITGGLFLLFRSREKRQQLHWERSMAQLKALGLQMNPHFLFHALNTVQHLAQQGKNRQVKEFTLRLSGFTRKILENSRAVLVSLDSELKTTEKYLRLERDGRPDLQLDFRMEHDPNLNPATVFVPPLLLQPLAENALIHGLYPKAAPPRVVTIHHRITDRGFQISVADNGIGRADSRQSKDGHHSLGLKNTRERLELYEQMGLGTARLNIRDLKDQNADICGTEVTLTFEPKPTNSPTR